jgi:tetratricopeptide (TPR) repeat protein
MVRGWQAGRRGEISPRLGRLIAALGVTIVLSLGALTAAQTRVWRDSTTLWRHAVALDPASAFAHFHLARALAIFGQRQEARAEFDRAIALVPDQLAPAKAVFYNSLGLTLQQEGDLAGAEQSYRQSLQIDGNNASTLSNLGNLYLARGDLGEALDAFARILRIRPGDPGACAQAARVAARLGRAAPELGSCRTPPRATDSPSPAVAKSAMARRQPVEGRGGISSR